MTTFAPTTVAEFVLVLTGRLNRIQSVAANQPGTCKHLCQVHSFTSACGVKASCLQAYGDFLALCTAMSSSRRVLAGLERNLQVRLSEGSLLLAILSWHLQCLKNMNLSCFVAGCVSSKSISSLPPSNLLLAEVSIHAAAVPLLP
jgi:hypothetical protein